MSYLNFNFNRGSLWPWAIGLSLGGFVLLQMAFIQIATNGFEGPDDVQYYKMGLEYSREVERQQVQRHNGWQLKVLQQQPLLCRVIDRFGQPLSGQMTVRFKRPATLSQDQSVRATPQGHEFLAPWQARSGTWLVQIDLDSMGQHFQRQLRWTLP